MSPLDRTRSLWPFVIGVIFIGLILRGPLIAVAPVTGVIRADLGLSAAQMGLLTSLPVLCFALVTPFASALVGKAGANLATSIAILGVGIGTIVRSAGGEGAAFTGTIIMGAFITVGNVVVPVLIRRDVPAYRVGIVTGAYTSALNVSSMVTSLATAPLAALLGWQAALLVWVGLAVLAAAAWLLAVGPRAAVRWGPLKPAVETGAVDSVIVDTRGVPVLTVREPRTWTSLSAVLLALAFAGQAFTFYGIAAWFPTLLQDEIGFDATTAGASSSVFQVTAVVGALGVPLLITRIGIPRTYALISALWISLPLGLLLAPDAWAVWSTLGGIAQGGGITVVFMLIVEMALDGTHSRRLSAMVQGTGYALGATAPTLIGAVHDATGGWSTPLVVLVGSALVFAGAGLTATVRASRALRAARP